MSAVVVIYKWLCLHYHCSEIWIRSNSFPIQVEYSQTTTVWSYAATSYSGNPSAVYAAQPQAPRRRRKGLRQHENTPIYNPPSQQPDTPALQMMPMYYQMYGYNIYQVCHSPLSRRFYPILASRHQRHCSPTFRHRHSHHTSNLPPTLISHFRVPRPCNPKLRYDCALLPS